MGHPALRGREDGVEAMKEMEKVQSGREGGKLRGQALRGSGRFCWQIRERTLQVDVSMLLSQHYRGSETSVTEPYLEKSVGEVQGTKAAPHSTPGHTEARAHGVSG